MDTLLDYKWDAFNRLNEVATPTGRQTFLYNARSHRVEKQSDSATTRFIYDYNSLLQEADQSNQTTAEYTHNLVDAYGSLVSQFRDGATSTYEFDAIGTASGLVSEAELQTDTYIHRAFGEVENETGTTTNPFRYAGQSGYYYENEFNEYFLSNRVYDPEVGRFTSKDPARSDLNSYRYAWNAPVQFTDPSGLDASSRNCSLPIHLVETFAAANRQFALKCGGASAEKAELARRNTIQAFCGATGKSVGERTLRSMIRTRLNEMAHPSTCDQRPRTGGDGSANTGFLFLYRYYGNEQAEAIVDFAKCAVDAAKEFAKCLSAIFDELWKSLKKQGEEIWNLISQLLDDPIGMIKQMIQSLIDTFKEGGIEAVLKGLLPDIEPIKELLNLLKPGAPKPTLEELCRAIGKAIPALIEIISMIIAVVGALKAGIKGIAKFLGSCIKLLPKKRCFAEGTLVWTEHGLRAIEKIIEGDRVWSWNFESHEWQLANVGASFAREYRGNICRIHVAGDEIAVTFGHPFWVVEGENLDERPSTDIEPHVHERFRSNMDGGAVATTSVIGSNAELATQGRWVDSRDLRVGDVLFTAGGVAPIESIEHGLATLRVYNFHVPSHRNYAVGENQVLVHNESTPGDCPECDDLCDVVADNAEATNSLRGLNPNDPDVLEGALAEGKPSGSYVHTHESGVEYVGKGGPKRAAQSAREVAERTGDPVARTVWEPAIDETQAFIDEARKIEQRGGIDNLHNQINSPGKKMQ